MKGTRKMVDLSSLLFQCHLWAMLVARPKKWLLCTCWANPAHSELRKLERLRKTTVKNKKQLKKTLNPPARWTQLILAHLQQQRPWLVDPQETSPASSSLQNQKQHSSLWTLNHLYHLYLLVPKLQSATMLVLSLSCKVTQAHGMPSVSPAFFAYPVPWVELKLLIKYWSVYMRLYECIWGSAHGMEVRSVSALNLTVSAQHSTRFRTKSPALFQSQTASSWLPPPRLEGVAATAQSIGVNVYCRIIASR